jgi:type IV secretory pathway VirB10-like protein
MSQLNSNSTGGSGMIPPTGVPLSLHGPRPMVTRVSRRAVLLAAVFGAALGLVILVVGFGDPRRAKRDGLPDENSTRASGLNDSVKDLPKDYTFDVRQIAQGVGYEGVGTSPVPATRPSGPSAQELALAEQLRQLAELKRKMLEQQRKELEQAMDSPLLFAGAKSARTIDSILPTTMPSAPTLPISRANILDGYGAMPGANRFGGTPIGAATGDAPTAAGTSQNQQTEKEAFLTKAAAIEPYLTKPLLTPVSKYELKAGSVIPAALMTAINTDLPGQVIGQVTENVYDSASGDYLLVPQGARLLGKYQSAVGNGQNRALLVWQRLIYPNGNSIILDGMPGTDPSGQAGVADEVDYHLNKLTTATALTTVLAYAGNLARGSHGSSGGSGSGGGNNGGQDVIGDTVAQQANRVGEKVIDKELDVQPTITVRSGWPLRVLVSKDLVLAPYTADAPGR